MVTCLLQLSTQGRGEGADSQGTHLGVEGGAQKRQGVKAVRWGRQGTVLHTGETPHGGDSAPTSVSKGGQHSQLHLLHDCSASSWGPCPMVSPGLYAIPVLDKA